MTGPRTGQNRTTGTCRRGSQDNRQKRNKDRTCSLARQDPGQANTLSRTGHRQDWISDRTESQAGQEHRKGSLKQDKLCRQDH
jgi:hypothetical protein